MPTKILVATDLHPAADEAIRQAHAGAAEGDTFAVCHVLPNLQPLSILFPQRNQENIFDIAALSARAEAAVRERVVQLTGRAPDSFEVFLDQGVDYAEITRRAAKWKADLVVVGTHGSTPLGHLLLGSCTERVARYSPCPVLVTRAGVESGSVIAATDFSDPSIPGIVAGSREAKRLGTSLVVVHAVDFTLPPPVASGGFFGLVPTTYSPQALAEMQAAAQVHLASTLKAANVDAEPVVVAGDAADAVVSEAETRHAQLIVVGTHGRTGLAHIALGSVAENIMRNAPCSVLVVRLASSQ